MKGKVQRYIGGKYILLLRGLLLLLLPIFILLPQHFGFGEQWYIDNLCDQNLSQDWCEINYMNHFFAPIADAALPMIIVLTLLAVIPAWLLRKWVRQVSWWLVPYVSFALLIPSPDLGGSVGVLFNFSYADEAQISAWILLIVTVLFVIGHFAYILARWNVDGPGARGGEQPGKGDTK